jgi:Cu/Ag efflux protein CusF
MKFPLFTLLALLALPPAALFAHEKSESAKNCGCDCCKGKDTCCCHEAKSSDDKPAAKEPRHPLKGVIVDVYADRSALLVKHEEIPGYMMAMTMLFKVDAATLKAAAKGQAITATLVERGGEYWLEELKPAK